MPASSKFFRSLGLGSSLLFAAILSDRSVAEDPVVVQEDFTFFEKQIRPLFVKHCYACHSEKGDNVESSLMLDRRQGWLQGGENGPVVFAGDVDASPLIRAVRYMDAGLQMPPTKPLEAADVAKLEKWVRMGAPAPDQTHSASSDDPSDPVSGKEHWAFRNIVKRHSPDLKETEWPRTRIDAFILSKLEDAGLAPVADADPRVLARRVYVQLTGIPPTPEQLHDYLSDVDPSAYERLVDRLLASPRFGERWGRHWLDLARYADSNGLDENFLFREAWRYRNWVIDAINLDMPFDRFVQMQIAGDLLPYESLEQRDRQRVATGFLLIGPKVLLGNDEKNQRMEIADEQIDTLGRALLGQTLGCARCHNHKFDPVPTADYYALAGIFASTRVMERRYMLGEQRLMEQLVGLGESGRELDDAYEEYWRQQPKRREEKKQAESALQLLKKSQEDELTRFIETSGTLVADGAKDRSKTMEERIAAQQALVASLAKSISEAPPIPPRAMIPTDIDAPADEHIRLAGQFDRLGEKIPRGFLTVLQDVPKEAIAPQQSGRLALGTWLMDAKQRSGQLTARVMANRIWHHLFGCGLVRTVDNFGRTGETPSHPELLDFLASELIQSEWSIKALVRQVVLSRTFQLSSQHSVPSFETDPSNRLLWRSHRRRLDPESFRDAMLSAANQLDFSVAKSTVSYLGDQATAVGQNKVRRRTDFPNRSVYLPVIRNDLPELFEILDFANPHTTTGMRPNTTVPAQGLFMLNDELVMDSSKATARRVLESAPTGNARARIERMFNLVLGDTPSELQMDLIEQFLKRLEQQFLSEASEVPQRIEAELNAMTLACHALFISSRFQYLE